MVLLMQTKVYFYQWSEACANFKRWNLCQKKECFESVWWQFAPRFWHHAQDGQKWYIHFIISVISYQINSILPQQNRNSGKSKISPLKAKGPHHTPMSPSVV